MIEEMIQYLNNDKVFTGCLMVLMNIGGRHVSAEVPKNVDNMFQSPWLRRLVVFAIIFIATHDIKISILLTLLFIIVFNYLLDEKSKTYILRRE